MLICTDASNNNNKFYELSINGDTVTARYGRVGTPGQTKLYSGGIATLNRLLHEKTKPKRDGSQYRQVAVAAPTAPVSNLASIAQQQLVKDTSNIPLLELIKDLSAVNRHQISSLSGGKITLDDAGLLRTPLGIVSRDAIVQAKQILSAMTPFVLSHQTDTPAFITLLNDYLMLVPQKVDNGRGWHKSFLSNGHAVAKQADFLDQLLSAADTLLSRASSTSAPVDTVFESKLDILSDPVALASINSFFTATSRSVHVSSSLRLKRVFTIENKQWADAFEPTAKKIGNVKRLWHGTRMFNVLSILRSGLIIPSSSPGSSFHITGRMFGDGIYFSDQSTKSLNYSYGYWDNNAKDSRCFMFLADVAMGSEFTPQKTISRIPAGYHSCFAKANHSGVSNNEMIVYSLSQARLTHLCEFAP